MAAYSWIFIDGESQQTFRIRSGDPVWETAEDGSIQQARCAFQVKSEDGGVIPGLYAAGRTAVGVCSRQYVSGLSIADCVYSGRRAGGAAARGEVYAAADAPAPTQSTPIEAKALEAIPAIREDQVADPSPEAHQRAARRARNEAPYPRQSLNRTIRRPGGATRVSSSQRGRLSKRAP